MSFKKFLPIFIVLIILAGGFVFGDDGTNHERENQSKKEFLAGKYNLKISYISSLILFILVGISIYLNKANFEIFTRLSKPLFILMVLVILITSLYLIGGTIYKNIASITKGPVHWHADFEIYNCEEKVDLVDPKGLSNKIGSPVYHEHNDNRLHVEGTVLSYESVDLKRFFELIGGHLDKNSITYPTNEGLVTKNNNDLCNNQESKLQVFLYRVTNPDDTKKSGFTFTQEKLTDFENYFAAPYSNVPPGDCLIIEFSSEKQKTDKICNTYKLAIEKGDLTEE